MSKERIVVKIGSSSLTNTQGGLSREKLTGFVKGIAALREEGHEVLLISSGAVAAGFTGLNYPARPVTLAGKQAAAAVGQGHLMQAYTEELQKYGVETGQILLTRDNFSNKEQYQNAYSTLNELLKRNVLPIINENDTIAVDELTFGDNDMLSALVGGLIHAGTLIIITDVNGIYDANPLSHPTAKRYHFLPSVTPELMAQAGASGSKAGTGGMRSKLEAAKTALSLGLNVFIGKGTEKEGFLDIIAGKGDGTYIGSPTPSVMKNKKQWLTLHSSVAGKIFIDQGAKEAILHRGKSLLPPGVTDVEGDFTFGDVVEISDEKGMILGRGQVNVSSNELLEIKGKSTKEAKQYTTRQKAEVIHRDNWVLYSKERSI